MSVEVLKKNITTYTGEGPHWDEKTNSLLFVDIGEGDFHKLNYFTGEDEKKHFDSPVSLVVPRKSGGYVIGLGRTLSHFDWDSESVTTIVEVEQGTKNRFNDGKCDARGRLWAGSMAQESSPAVLELEQGSLYSLNLDRKLTQHLDKISISNGLDWTDDNSIMFFIDSICRQVWAYDFDINSGSISNKRTVVDFGGKETMDDLGFPDGMTIDNNGNIWVACYGAGKVICFDTATGKSVRTIEFPESKKMTSCCFGGPNMDEMFVTSGTYNLTPEQVKAEQPLAGSVYKVTGLGVKGRLGNVYEG